MGRRAAVVLGQGPLPSPLTDAEKDAAILAGDTELLILTHMRLGCSVASKFVYYGGDRKEMISVALYAIVEAVNRFNPAEHASITGYIDRYIHQHCAKALRDQDTITRPRSRKGPRVVSLNGCEYVEDDRRIELDEILESLPRTPTERAVLDARRMGANDDEIAEELDVHRTTISRIRTKLHERYRRIT